DRLWFQELLKGQRFAIGRVSHARRSGDWIVPIGRSVEDQAGQLKAVLAMGTRLERIEEILRTEGFPAGSAIRIVDEDAIVVGQSANGPNWIGRDLSESEVVARHIVAKEASEVVFWSDGVQRITGSSTAHKVPWLVSVGIPSSTMFAGVLSKLRWGVLLSTTT